MTTDLVLLHGLTYDRRHWDPMLRELARIDPGRRVLALDLPGHGDAARRDSYHLAEVVELIHDQVEAAGLTAPAIVGHSIGGVLATTYAARFDAVAVLNLDQPLLLGPFGAAVRAAEPELRGPGWRAVWNRMLAGMGIEHLPADARHIAETFTHPRPDLLLGYWDEILRGTDDEITASRAAELATITDRGIAYHWVTSAEPPAPYRDWLTAALPKVEITVLPGSHFPHLAHPAEVARLAATL